MKTLTDAKSTDIHVTKYVTKYGRPMQSIMYKSSSGDEIANVNIVRVQASAYAH